MPALRLEDFPDELCRHCGKPVQRKRSDAIYCSRRCAVDHYNHEMGVIISEERRQARAGRTCKQCGKTFDANRSDQVYCQRKCQSLATYYRLKERIRCEAV